MVGRFAKFKFEGFEMFGGRPPLVGADQCVCAMSVRHISTESGFLFLWFIVLVVVHSLKDCWWFWGQRMEARLHSQAHKTAT